MANPYRYVLPEVAVSRYDRPRKAPVFPPACPRCGAAQAGTPFPWTGPTYACGAVYAPKPQIQNHTDKWWGVCPVTEAEVKAEQAQRSPAGER